MATDRRVGPGRKVGTSTKVGASSGIDGDICWVIEIDWDGDGAFDGSNEARWFKNASSFVGRRRMFRADGLGMEPMEPGSMAIELDNSTRRYDASYSSSALYPNIYPDKLARVRIYYPTTGAFANVITGRLVDITTNGSGVDATATLIISDRQEDVNALRAPMRAFASIGQYPTEITDACVQALGYGALTTYGTYSWRPFEMGYTTGDETYGAFLHGLASDHLCYFYFDLDGTPSFRVRGYAGSSQRDYDQADLCKEIQISQPWRNSRNLLHLRARPVYMGLYAGTLEVYGAANGAFFVPAGTTKTFFIRHFYNGLETPVLIDPFFVDPSLYGAAPTFEAFANSDGTGTNLTANFTMDDAENLGIGGVFTFTNSGGTDGWVFLTVEGYPHYEQNGFDLYYPEDPTTVSRPHELYIYSKWFQYSYNATQLRDDVQDFFDSNQKFIIIELEANPAKQFFTTGGASLKLFQEITLTSSYYGISGETFLIAGIAHRTTASPQIVRTTLYLEPRI